jgi:hypothetical protein
VLIDPDHRYAVETGRIGDQDPAAFGQYRVVGGVPRHREPFSDSGHAQVLQTRASSAHCSARRESLARGGATLLVSWRHTWAHPAHR